MVYDGSRGVGNAGDSAPIWGMNQPSNLPPAAQINEIVSSMGENFYNVMINSAAPLTLQQQQAIAQQLLAIQDPDFQNFLKSNPEIIADLQNGQMRWQQEDQMYVKLANYTIAHNSSSLTPGQALNLTRGLVTDSFEAFASGYANSAALQKLQQSINTGAADIATLKQLYPDIDKLNKVLELMQTAKNYINQVVFQPGPLPAAWREAWGQVNNAINILNKQ